jgi:hypothetical protein
LLEQLLVCDELILKGGCEAVTLTNVFYRSVNFIPLDTMVRNRVDLLKRRMGNPI